MNDSSQNEAEIQQLKHEELFSSKRSETNEETSMSIKDPDTMLSMIILLLTCLALAALAHVVV